MGTVNETQKKTVNFPSPIIMMIGTLVLVLGVLLLVKTSLKHQTLLYSRQAFILDTRGLTPVRIHEISMDDNYQQRGSELWYLGKDKFEFHAPPTIRLILIKNSQHQNQGKMGSVSIAPHYVKYVFKLPFKPPITVVTNGGTFQFRIP
jgi:hypothetical protein